MHVYRPKKRPPWRRTVIALRVLAHMLRLWPLFILAALLISPVGPHLRLQYSYRLHGSHRVMIACEYLGARGRIRYMADGRCPLIAIVDSRTLTDERRPARAGPRLSPRFFR